MVTMDLDALDAIHGFFVPDNGTIARLLKDTGMNVADAEQAAEEEHADND